MKDMVNTLSVEKAGSPLDSVYGVAFFKKQID
jgi:hypothetical protein